MTQRLGENTNMYPK